MSLNTSHSAFKKSTQKVLISDFYYLLNYLQNLLAILLIMDIQESISNACSRCITFYTITIAINIILILLITIIITSYAVYITLQRCYCIETFTEIINVKYV